MQFWQNYWLAIQNAKEELETIRKEIVSAIKERDSIYEEVSKQRTAKTEVSLEIKSLEDTIWYMNNVFLGIRNDIESKKIDFERLTENEKRVIEKMRDEMQSIETLLLDYESRKWQIINVDSKNRKTKSIIQSLETQKTELEIQVKELKEQKENLSQEIESERLYILKEKDIIRIEKGENIEEKRRLAKERNRLRKFCKENNISIKDI